MRIRGFIGILALLGAVRAASAANYVIQISVDGLGSQYLQNLLPGGTVPNFQRLINQGAYTYNARTDYDITETLPNHTCMLTGRGVWEGDTNKLTTHGHGWSANTDPASTDTIANNRGSRPVQSTFDVVHPYGSTGLYASKSKFILYPQSFSTIDQQSITNYDAVTMQSAYLAAMNTTTPLKYSFVHYYNPDYAGHNQGGWGSANYNAAVQTVDGYLGQILALIDNPSSPLRDHTDIILTADHGGSGTAHADATLAIDYTIPFLAWGPGVVHGDLYAFNGGTRWDPGTSRILYSDAHQPIRSSDGANLAMKLLGLPAITDSTVNASQNLAVPEPAAISVVFIAALGMLRRRPRVRNS